MAVLVSVSDEIFKRLENQAIGFDTPERVIERLLDELETGSSDNCLEKRRDSAILTCK